jgi:hypothetical protein
MDNLTTAIDTADIDLTGRLARKAGKLRAAVNHSVSELDTLLPFLPDGYNRELIKNLRSYLSDTVADIDGGKY